MTAAEVGRAGRVKLVPVAVSLAEKYEGPGAGQEYLQLPPELVRVVFRLTPQRVLGSAAG